MFARSLRSLAVAALSLRPERVPFISYPYEWSFGQLKDAALATLSIHKRALKLGMALKDASAYNIQFLRGRAALIDTLSFELYKEGQPWVAYRQFCQHFLAPLALMAWKDVRLNQLLRIYIDGVPLDLASKLLPWRTRLNFGLLTHIHLHAGAQKRYAGEDGPVTRRLDEQTGHDRPDREPRGYRPKARVEARRHGVGELLRYYQLFRRSLRAQETAGGGVDGAGRRDWRHGAFGGKSFGLDTGQHIPVKE